MFSFLRKKSTLVNKAFFSPGTACLDAITNSIENARSSINICVFTISDDRITRAILAAHKSGVKVRILTDNEKLNDLGSDIKQMAQAKIEIKVDNTQYHMHHKFVVIDNQVLLTGSYNWTRNAAQFNHENLLVTNNPDLVKSYNAEFTRLWAQMGAL